MLRYGGGGANRGMCSGMGGGVLIGAYAQVWGVGVLIGACAQVWGGGGANRGMYCVCVGTCSARRQYAEPGGGGRPDSATTPRQV